MAEQLTRRFRSAERTTLVAAALVAAITLVGFGLRVWHLDTEPLHVDEIKQVTEVQEPWAEIIGLSYRHQQPPLDYLIGKTVVSVFPATDFVQRFPAALFGTGTVALVGIILIRFGMPVAAVLAAWFSAISPFLIEFSQYARPYALPIFMVALTIAFHQHWHLGHRNRRTLIAFSVASAAALLSRATMPLVALVTLGLVALWTHRDTISLRTPMVLLRRDPLAFVILPAAFWLVWVPSFFAARAMGGRGFLATCCPYDVWDRLAVGVGNAGSFGEQAVQPVSLLALVVLALVMSFVPMVRERLMTAATLWVPLLATAPGFALVHALTTRPGQFFARRYMVFLPIGLAVSAAIAAAAVVRRGPVPWVRWGSAAVGGVVGVVVSVSMLGSVVDQARDQALADWRSTGEYLEEVEQPGDVIVSIDTRPFKREFRFGFMAQPRYYEGTSVVSTPDDVIVAPASVLMAGRYHFVLFVPKMAAGWALPEDWDLERYSNMIIATTPELEDDAGRLDAWWTLTEALRPDVAVRTRIAGAALAEVAGASHHPWAATAVAAAESIGQREYAETLLATATGG